MNLNHTAHLVMSPGPRGTITTFCCKVHEMAEHKDSLLSVTRKLRWLEHDMNRLSREFAQFARDNQLMLAAMLEQKAAEREKQKAGKNYCLHATVVAANKW